MDGALLLERLKSATFKTLGNRSSGSSQSTGSAVFCRRSTPSRHFVICCQDSGDLPSRSGTGLGLVKPDVRSREERLAPKQDTWEMPGSSSITRFAPSHWSWPLTCRVPFPKIEKLQVQSSFSICGGLVPRANPRMCPSPYIKCCNTKPLGSLSTSHLSYFLPVSFISVPCPAPALSCPQPPYTPRLASCVLWSMW